MTTHPTDVAQLGRRFFEAQDRLRGGPDPALCTADYRATIGSNPSMTREGHEGFARGFYAGFPDAEHHFDQVMASGDRAIVRFVIKGTHTGNFFGIPASGRSIATPAHAILRVIDGKVAEVTAVFDEAGMLRQIGVLPS